MQRDSNWSRRTIGGSTKKQLEDRVAVLDGFHTPLIAIKTLLKKEELASIVWEPAVGYHRLSQPLRKRGYKVFTSDIHDWDDRTHIIKDFAKFSKPPANLRGKLFDICTNPPFKHASMFVEKGLELLPDKGKLILLVRLQFLEGIKRGNTIFKYNPPKRVYIYSFRLPRMRRFDFKGKQTTSALCFCWMVWTKNYKGPTELRWLRR